jgi:hypothetical protein
MKRDVDTARQLLLEVENRGAECSVNLLRPGLEAEPDQRIRYHLRLLIDAGLLREIERTAPGVPCVRLTHAGHELLELIRSETAWREAKLACQHRTGGLSLTVIRGILLRWAWSGRRYVAAYRYGRRRRAAAAPRYLEGEWGRPRYETLHGEALRAAEQGDLPAEEPFGWRGEGAYRFVRVGPEVADRWHMQDAGWDVDGDGFGDAEFDASLPDYLI